jgi:hypothetical protein
MRKTGETLMRRELRASELKPAEMGERAQFFS